MNERLLNHTIISSQIKIIAEYTLRIKRLDHSVQNASHNALNTKPRGNAFSLRSRIQTLTGVRVFPGPGPCHQRPGHQRVGVQTVLTPGAVSTVGDHRGEHGQLLFSDVDRRQLFGRDDPGSLRVMFKKLVTE